MNLAKDSDVRLRAEFLPTDCNRMMDITYRFAKFYEIERVGKRVMFEHDLTDIPTYPVYVKLQTAVEGDERLG
jgi:hypothetical protein